MHAISAERCLILLLFTFGLIGGISDARAQIVVDHSFGAGGALTPVNGNFNINAGLGKTVGTNLFHSFDQFNINTGQSATFSGPNGITNVISRVTGSNASTIDGTLRSTIPGADVYLINPNGVIFNANAKLDVKGSFAAGTANQIRLKDGKIYSASHPLSSTLTSAPPAAFGFLGAPVKSINVNGSQLSVPAGTSTTPGKAISLVGGNININKGKATGAVAAAGASISAPAGRINLVSVASAGEVSADINDPAVPTLLDTSAFPTLGNIDIRGGSKIMSNSLEGGGSIVVRAQKLTLAENSSIVSQTGGSVNGRLIDVNVRGDLSIYEGSQLQSKTSALAVPLTIGDEEKATGNGTTLNVTVGGNLLIQGVTGKSSTTPTGILAGTQTAGNGGNLTLNVDGSVTVTGGGAEIAAQRNIFFGSPATPFPPLTAAEANAYSQALTGSGGNLILNTTGTNGLTITDNGRILSGTLAGGPSGSLVIQSRNDINLSANGDILAGNPTAGGTMTGAPVFSAGPGPVFIRAGGNLNISGAGSSISDTTTAASRSSAQPAGDLTINVNGSLAVSGGGAIKGDSTGAGQASDVIVTATHLLLDGGQISATNSTTSYGAGGGGTGQINVTTTDEATLENKSLITNAAGPLSTASAPIHLQIGGGLQVLSGSAIAATSAGAAPAGAITLGVSGELLMNDGTISSATPTGTGSTGEIDLITLKQTTLANGSLITNAAGKLSSSGAPINLQIGGGLQVLSASAIAAPSAGVGTAGTITLTVNGPLLMNDGMISSTNLNGAGSTGGISVTTFQEATLQNGSLITNAAGMLSTGSAPINFLAGGGLQVLSRSTISTSTAGAAPGGAITLDVSGRLLVDNGIITGSSTGTGRASIMGVDADQITLENGAQIQNLTGPNSAGGSSITLLAGASVQVLSGSVINADTVGASPAGTITIENRPDAASAVQIKVSGTNSAIRSDSAGTGAPGQVTIDADRLKVGRGGQISGVAGLKSETGGGKITITTNDLAVGKNGKITTDTSGPGTGGNLKVLTGTLLVGPHGAISSNTFGAGNGGTINLDVAGKASIEGNIIADVGKKPTADKSNAASSGRGGNVVITAQEVVTGGKAKIEADTHSTTGQATNPAAGMGGSISIHATDRVLLTATSGISANSFGTGQGGSVRIASPEVTVNAKPGVQANAFGSGDGGKLVVKTDNLTVTESGTIAAVSENAGNTGSLKIRANDTVLIKGVIDADIAAPVSTGNGGTVSIAARDIELSGPQAVITASTASTAVGTLIGRGGSIYLNATDTLSIYGGGSIAANTAGGHQGGQVEVEAPHTIISGSGIDRVGNLRLSAVGGSASNSGNAGNLTIIGDDLTLANAGSIVLETTGTGAAGTAQLSLSQSIDVLSGAAIQGNSRIGSGTAANIMIDSPSAHLLVSGQGTDAKGMLYQSTISALTSGAGKGGQLTINALDATVGEGGSLSASTTGAGDAGQVALTLAGPLTVRSGGKIEGATYGPGKAGDVTVTAASVLVTDAGSTINSSSSNTAGNLQGSTGGAGNVTVTAGQLTLQQGGRIATDVGSNAVAGGTPGSISLHVPGQLDLFSGGLISATTSGPIQAGDISIDGGQASATSAPPPAGSVLIDGGGQGATSITASSTATGANGGDAGKVSIATAGNVDLMNGGSIATNSTRGGGDIIVHSQRDITLTNAPSGMSNKTAISAVVMGGDSPSGDGNIELRARGTIVAFHGTISANSNGSLTPGGNVTIADGTHFLILDDTAITAIGTNQGGKIVNDADFTFATASSPTLVSAKAGEFDLNGLPNVFDATAATGNSGTVLSRAPDLSLSSTLGQVTYRTPDLIVVNQYPASEKQLTEAKQGAANYLDAAAGRSVSRTPAPASPVTSVKRPRQAATPAAESAPRATRRTAAAAAEEPVHRLRRAETAPPPPPAVRVKPGVIAVQVSKRSEGSADTIGVVLIDTVSRQPTSPDVYEISRKRLESGDSVTIEGQSATLVAATRNQ